MEEAEFLPLVGLAQLLNAPDPVADLDLAVAYGRSRGVEGSAWESLDQMLRTAEGAFDAGLVVIGWCGHVCGVK